MGHDETLEDIVYREFCSSFLGPLQERQGLEDIRETLAAWYGVPLESVSLNWNGNKLSGQIFLQYLDDTRFIFGDVSLGEPIGIATEAKGQEANREAGTD